MGRKRHTPEQIITSLREAEVGLARGKSLALGRPAGSGPPESSRSAAGATVLLRATALGPIVRRKLPGRQRPAGSLTVCLICS